MKKAMTQEEWDDLSYTAKKIYNDHWPLRRYFRKCYKEDAFYYIKKDTDKSIKENLLKIIATTCSCVVFENSPFDSDYIINLAEGQNKIVEFFESCHFKTVESYAIEFRLEKFNGYNIAMIRMFF